MKRLALDLTKCTVDGCLRPAKARRRGMCESHYKRQYRYGDPRGGSTDKGAVQKFFNDVVLKYEGADCLTWPFYRGADGYATMRRHRGGVHHPVARLVCEAAYGPAPMPYQVAAHNCGRGHEGCVSKQHLRWATVAENSADMVGHGTALRGDRNGHAKLTEGDVRAIRSGVLSQRATAKHFGVSQSVISGIRLGKTWAWLT